MKGVKTYQPPQRASPVSAFLDGLEPKLRDKLIRQIFQLPQTPLTELKEPHYKHFSLERYRSFYELREKGKVLVRVIFTYPPEGGVLLLHAFVKRQKRDTMQALEQSLRILALLREHPERAVEFKVKEEAK